MEHVYVPGFYVSVMEHVYGLDLSTPDLRDFKIVFDNVTTIHAQLVKNVVKNTLLANMRIRDQICAAGIITISVCWILMIFCVIISCCSERNTRLLINESIRAARDVEPDDEKSPPSPPKNQQLILGELGLGGTRVGPSCA